MKKNFPRVVFFLILILQFSVHFILTGCNPGSSEKIEQQTPKKSEVSPESDSLINTPEMENQNNVANDNELTKPKQVISPENTSQLTEIDRLGKGILRDIVWSPDGSLLAFGTSTGVYFYDSQTFEELNYIDTGSYVTELLFSPEGDKLAVVSITGGIYIIKLNNSGKQELVRLFEEDPKDKICLAFSKSGKFLASGDLYGNIQIWDIENNIKLHTLSGHSGTVSAITFSQNDSTLVSVSYDQTMRLWDVQSGSERQLREVSGGNWFFSPDGSQLFFTNEANSLIVYDVESANVLGQIENINGSSIFSMGTSISGNYFAFSNFKDVVHVWDLETRKKLSTYEGHQNTISTIAFSPNGQSIVSGDSDGIVHIWNMDNGSKISTINDFVKSQGMMALTTDWGVLAAPTEINTIHLINLNNNNRFILEGHTQSINFIDFSPDGKTLASCSEDRTLRFWDVDTGLQNNQFDFLGNALAFSSDNSLLGLKGWDGNVILLNFENGEASTLSKGLGYAWSQSDIAFSPDSKLVAAGRENTIFIWDAINNNNLHTLEGHTDEIYSVTFSPDSKMLASSSHDGTIILWDIETGTKIASLSLNKWPIRT